VEEKLKSPAVGFTPELTDAFSTGASAAELSVFPLSGTAGDEVKLKDGPAGTEGKYVFDGSCAAFVSSLLAPSPFGPGGAAEKLKLGVLALAENENEGFPSCAIEGTSSAFLEASLSWEAGGGGAEKLNEGTGGLVGIEGAVAVAD